MARDEEIINGLVAEAGISRNEAELYLRILRAGAISLEARGPATDSLLSKGMIIVSGNNLELKPVHPRLAIANGYRTWRENMVREINQRRMRVDKLILELIPVYEAATEKRTD